MKTLVDENIFPKTTHSFLTCYYTWYIESNVPQTSIYKPLVQYFCINDSFAAIQIKVTHSTLSGPQLVIFIVYQNGNVYNRYIVSAETPKKVTDLTADLVVVSPGQKIISAQFT
jgi:hypothetical protein